MGLDSVEILVEVEKTLGIEISNAEASKIYTVGDFHESAWKQIQNKRPLADKCFLQMTFYKLRQKFIETINIDKSVFRPDQQIEEIFPKENRRLLWRNLQNAIDLQLPDLELISPFNIILATFGFTLDNRSISNFYYSNDFIRQICFCSFIPHRWYHFDLLILYPSYTPKTKICKQHN